MRKTVGGVMHRVYAGQYSGGKLVGRSIVMSERGEIWKFFSGKDGKHKPINRDEANDFAKVNGIQAIWNRHAKVEE